ncbi:MAG: hypothetical protein B7L53_05585 [Thermofilum sp. NZ13]|nr:MAG: hypothetical protein B7L53_05585 [Thermofilum sp. NZ13]
MKLVSGASPAGAVCLVFLVANALLSGFGSRRPQSVTRWLGLTGLATLSQISALSLDGRG